MSLIAAVLAGGAAPSMAADQGIYIGAGIGFTHDGNGCEVLDSNNNRIPTTQCDTNSVEPAVYAGYRFSESLAVEVGYMGLRDTTVTLSGNRQASFEATGIPVSGVLYLPAGADLLVFGKLGLLRWSGESNTNFAGNDSDSGFSYLIGAGVDYRISGNLYLRGELQYMPKVGDEATVGEADITVVGVSVKWIF